MWSAVRAEGGSGWVSVVAASGSTTSVFGVVLDLAFSVGIGLGCRLCRTRKDRVGRRQGSPRSRECRFRAYLSEAATEHERVVYSLDRFSSRGR